VKCVTGTLMVNHWSASMWFYLHRVVETDQRLTWAIQDNLAHFDEDTKTHSGRDKSIIYCYVRGFHFVITALSTVGYGDIRPYGNIETIFQVLIILTAACLFAGTIGSIGVYFDHSDSTGRTAFKSRMGKLKEYMRYRSLPQRLQESIIVHFEALWERQKGIDSVKVLRELSVPLRLDIAVQVNNDVLSNVKVLKACPFHIQRHLALNLRPHACLDQDFVYRVGDLGFEIYFITSGKLIVLTSKNKVKRNLRNGDHFGTPSVRVNPPQSASRTESVAKLDQQSFAFNGGVRTETIQAVSKCTFFTLHTKELENVARAYPECAELELFKSITVHGHKAKKKEKGNNALSPSSQFEEMRRLSMSLPAAFDAEEMVAKAKAAEAERKVSGGDNNDDGDSDESDDEATPEAKPLEGGDLTPDPTSDSKAVNSEPSVSPPPRPPAVGS